MPTLFRVGAWRIVVYPNDHEPAHLHVVGPDGHARFAMGRGPDDVALLESDGVPTPVLRRIAARIIDRHAPCLESWRAVHGHQVANRKRR